MSNLLCVYTRTGRKALEAGGVAHNENDVHAGKRFFFVELTFTCAFFSLLTIVVQETGHHASGSVRAPP